MKRLTYSSDKLNDYSDYERKIRIIFKKTTRIIASSVGIYRSRLIAWLSDRIVQKMWQNWLQMFNWSWSWPKALFIYQFSWRKAKDALCAKRVLESGGGAIEEFSTSKGVVRRDLRIESRIIEKARKYLNAGGFCQQIIRPLGVRRYFSVMHSHGKYVGGLSFRANGGGRWERF